jgi:hypothetical protein
MMAKGEGGEMIQRKERIEGNEKRECVVEVEASRSNGR